MTNKLDIFNQLQLKKDLPDIHSGDTVRVYQKIKEGGKERIQPFEGVVIARKHGKGISSTITVRKLVGGIGVEKIYPLHSPIIEKIEILKRAKVRRAKLYFLRKAKGKRARLKQKEFAKVIPEESSIAPAFTEASVDKNASEDKEKEENQKKSH